MPPADPAAKRVGTTVPDFFLVGAPKSGTTAMYEYLRQHPEIWAPERKELRYFGSDLDIRDSPRRSLQEYLDFFAPAEPARRIGTAYVWYLYSTRAAREIREFAPSAEILVMLRNPVDVMYALHSESLYNGYEDIEDFAQALAAEDDRRQGRRLPRDARLVDALLYRRVPRYTDQLERYFDAFGRDKVHVIVFDDFASHPGDAYARTLRFLGVSDAFRPDFEVINPNKRVRSRTLLRALNAPSPSVRRAVRLLVPRRLRQTLYPRAQLLNVTTPRRRPIDPSLRRTLQREFEPEVERLSALLGRDLTHWSRD